MFLLHERERRVGLDVQAPCKKHWAGCKERGKVWHEQVVLLGWVQDSSSWKVSVQISWKELLLFFKNGVQFSFLCFVQMFLFRDDFIEIRFVVLGFKNWFLGAMKATVLFNFNVVIRNVRKILKGVWIETLVFHFERDIKSSHRSDIEILFHSNFA